MKSDNVFTIEEAQDLRLKMSKDLGPDWHSTNAETHRGIPKFQWGWGTHFVTAILVGKEVVGFEATVETGYQGIGVKIVRRASSTSPRVAALEVLHEIIDEYTATLDYWKAVAVAQMEGRAGPERFVDVETAMQAQPSPTGRR